MRPRTLAFVNADYIPVARNWLLGLRAIDLEDTATLVALDEETRSAFAPDRVIYRPLDVSAAGLGALWVHRMEVIRTLLAGGEAIIHSDVDAVWLRDPLADIAACGAPVVFSQGTVWPPDIHRAHGVVLCCGFFYLAPKPEVLSFMDAVSARLTEEQDDQVSFNRSLAEVIDGWSMQDVYEIPFGETVFRASRTPMRSIPKAGHVGPSVTILPHHAYPRAFDKITPETVVAHPFSGKTLSEKKECLSHLGLWFG